MYRRLTNTIVVTLPNGLTLSGDRSLVESNISKLGYLNNLYYSESKQEWLLISEMETNHLANAVSKMLAKNASDLVRFLNNTMNTGVKKAKVLIEDYWETERLVTMIKELKSRDEYL